MSNNLFTPEYSERIELLCQLNRLEASLDKLRELVALSKRIQREKEKNRQSK